MIRFALNGRPQGKSGHLRPIFLFLELSPPALIKTSIGGVYFGIEAFPFPKMGFFLQKMQLNSCFLVLPSPFGNKPLVFMVFF
jgi:hypothetical protein